jgi:hypothetical protein
MSWEIKRGCVLFGEMRRTYSSDEELHLILAIKECGRENLLNF